MGGRIRARPLDEIRIGTTEGVQEIVRLAEELFKTVDALEARHHKAKASLNCLTQSVLARVFRGEFVPQDPNDESASVLPEKVRKD